MKINASTTIVGQNIILVPYREQHVLKYHGWMESAELQKLTASEPLTLEQEYEMQKSWREDADKCTFIILDKQKYNQQKDEVDAMVGDTNIFLIDSQKMIGEIEIMIAEPFARGKKFGWEGVVLMLLYGIKFLNINIFQAKISMVNHISIRLFRKLKFYEKSRSDIFDEVTFEKNVETEWQSFLENQFHYEIKSF